MIGELGPLVRVKYLANDVVEKSDGSMCPYLGLEDVKSTVGELVFSGIGEKAAEDSLTANPGDVLFGKLRPYLAKSYLVESNLTCTGEFLVLRPTERVNASFLFYVTLSQLWLEWAKASSYGSKMPRTSSSAMGDLQVPLPERGQQEAISLFLDRETGKIDALIDKQHQLIEALCEDRTAIITHAVTKGLNPNAEMKDSGVGWIGTIPVEWTLRKVKHGFGVTLGKMYQAEPRSPEDVALPHLKAGSLTADGLNVNEPMECWFSPSDINNLTLYKGDVLIVEGGSIGRCVVLDQDMPQWGFQKSLNRARALRDDSPHFLAYLIEAATQIGHISILCGKSTIPHFTSEKVEALEWPHPSPAQQLTIVKYLDRECAKMDRLIAKANDLTASLSEYRAALITAAVTGKIDVREAV